MKKSKSPYLITDRNNRSAYYSLMYGLIKDDLSAIEIALKNKAKISCLMLDESGSNYLSEDDDASYELVSVLEYAINRCSIQVFEKLCSQVKMDDELRFKIVVRKMKDYLDSSSEKSLTELVSLVKKHFNHKNINKKFTVLSMNDPFSESWRQKPCEASLLHIACAMGIPEVVDCVLEMGAKANEVIKNPQKTPSNIAIEFCPSRGNQEDYIQILLSLIKAGANLDLKNSNRQYGWTLAINKFKIPELRRIFANHSPKNLSILEEIKSRSRHLYDYWYKHSAQFDKYPLLKDIITFEKRKVEISSEGTAYIEGFEKFFKHKSLKEALSQRYGFSSNRLTKFFNENLLDRNEVKPVVQINGTVMKVTDLLVAMFKENSSDLLDVLENKNNVCESVLKDLTYYCHQKNTRLKDFVCFMKENFTDAQIKAILTTPCEDTLEVTDTLDMYKKFPKDYRSLMQKVPFHKVNDLNKIHDFIAAKSRMMEQENFNLNQDKNFPVLKSIKELKLPNNHGIKIPEQNYDLISWGAEMGHCVGGGQYGEEVKKGETIILAITENSEPKYCVEINPNGRIEQIQGRSRSIPPKEVIAEFIAQLKKNKVVNRQQKVSDWIN